MYNLQEWKVFMKWDFFLRYRRKRRERIYIIYGMMVQLDLFEAVSHWCLYCNNFCLLG